MCFTSRAAVFHKLRRGLALRRERACPQTTLPFAAARNAEAAAEGCGGQGFALDVLLLRSLRSRKGPSIATALLSLARFLTRRIVVMLVTRGVLGRCGSIMVMAKMGMVKNSDRRKVLRLLMSCVCAMVAASDLVWGGSVAFKVGGKLSMSTLGPNEGCGL